MQNTSGSPLFRHLAASEGSYKVTEWLLSEKADINSLDRFKRTPLEVRPSLDMLLVSRQGASQSNAHAAGCCSWRIP